MAFHQRGRLFKVGQHSRSVGGVLLGLAGEGGCLRRFQCQAPMQIDAAKACRLFKKRQPVIHKDLRDRIGVMLFPWQIEAGHHARVLVQTRPFGQAAQRAFNRAHLRLKLLVGQSLFVNSSKRKQAAVAAALQRKDSVIHKPADRNDAARGSGLGVPRRVFQLLSVCAGHSRTSGSDSSPKARTSWGVCGRSAMR